jgi:thiol-disulfide isomerase/thioredoxin
MKELKFIFIMLFAATFTNAQNRSINFEKGNWEEILAKAEKENKIIFLDAYTTWCGPCKWMAANVFTNDTVADFYNQYFVNAKIDMEKGEGIELAKRFNIRAYPTLLFINVKGEVMHRLCGAAPTNILVKQGLLSLNPYENLSFLTSQYENGKRDIEFMKNYLDFVSGACLNTSGIAEEYLSSIPQQDLLSEKYWELIKNYIDKEDAPAFQFFLANQKSYVEKFGKEEVKKKIAEVYSNQINSIVYGNFDEKKFAQAKENIRKSGMEDAEMIIFMAELGHFENTGNWKKYAALAIEGADNYLSTEPYILNAVAWNFYENINDKKLLAKAESWAVKSTTLMPEHFNYDTYAAVLYKLGKKAEAIKAQEKAIELAKEKGESTEDYEEMLKKIKSGK